MTGLIKAYIGLGANLGDRVEQIINARQRLRVTDGIYNLQCSALFISSPVGYSDQADFVNCAVQIDTDLSAMALLRVMQQIEIDLGRVRDPRNQNSPRAIDLDLLLFDDQQLDLIDLITPHPRLTERLFVLEPLLDLTTDLSIAGLGRVSDIIQQGHKNLLFDDQRLHRLGRSE